MSGLHIFEDAFVVQIVDVDTGEVLPDGEQGVDLHHRDLQDRISPQFRYNIMDLSTLHPAGPVRLWQLAAEAWLPSPVGATTW